MEHTHTKLVEGCYRCELNRDEIPPTYEFSIEVKKEYDSSRPHALVASWAGTAMDVEDALAQALAWAEQE